MMIRSELPRDARSLRRMLAEKDAALAERELIIAEKQALLSERDRVIAARDSELYAKTLQIEHLKARLAVLRRARFAKPPPAPRSARTRPPASCTAALDG